MYARRWCLAVVVGLAVCLAGSGAWAGYLIDFSSFGKIAAATGQHSWPVTYYAGTQNELQASSGFNTSCTRIGIFSTSWNDCDESMPMAITISGGYAAYKTPVITTVPGKTWGVMGKRNADKYDLVVAYMRKNYPLELNAYNGPVVSTAPRNSAWWGGSYGDFSYDVYKSLYSGSAFAAYISYVKGLATNFPSNNIRNVMQFLAEATGPMTVEMYVKDTNGNDLIREVIPFYIKPGITVRWDGKYDSTIVAPAPDMSVGDDGTIAPTPTVDNSAWYSGFWDNLKESIRGLFVPSQAKIDELRDGLTDFTHLAPIAIITEFKDALTNEDNVNWFGEEGAAPNEHGYVSRVLHFGSFTIPWLGTVPLAVDVGPSMAWLRWLRVFMGVGLWCTFAFAVWHRFRGAVS